MRLIALEMDVYARQRLGMNKPKANKLTTESSLPAVPTGPRVITSQELAQYFGGTPTWWSAHRPRLVAAGLMFKVGKKHMGDYSKIQAAIGEPSFWEGA